MKPLYKTCDGCRSLIENRHEHGICSDLKSFKYTERAKTCPCSICIVKGVCWDGCDDFNNFIMEMHGVAERIKDEEKTNLQQTYAIDSNDSGRDAKTMRPCKLCR